MKQDDSDTSESLFVLNLRCPVLQESLRDHPPKRLKLQINGWCGSGDPELRGLISPEAAATLTHLTLCATYLHYSSPDPPPLDYLAARWDDIWRDGLLPFVTPLHALTHFRLVFHLDGMEAAVPMWPITQDPLIEDLRPISRARGRFDFAAVASKLADTLPSLRYCFLTNSAWVTAAKDVHSWPVVVEQWRESRARRVAHGLDVGHTTAESSAAAAVETRDTGRELAELHDDVAETILQAEALVLSTEERQGVRWV
ncbi:hypothetical protein GSI_08880 [Ganoderma sinense ZZ0214-1]|uniref:Uncharacterized protein n=1 Tax=Ganoderma sinense ZZ0214-1 TaxID=1077348 RepID=A0A2G8S514_9APHY|nr:hypothetical protein GSI_08880 [Ganoderma sinense ZZ0214-1]